MNNRHLNDDDQWSLSELAAAMSSVQRFLTPVDGRAPDAESEFNDSAIEGLSAVFCDLKRCHTAEDKWTVSNRADPSSFAQSLVGVRVGRFEVTECLGYGGFGIVFRAYDRELDRDVALKIPRPERIKDPALKERVLDEARAAAKLKHAGIVHVHDVGSMGPIAFITSELCEGMTLQAWLLQLARPLPPRVAARFVMDVACAIGYAHTRGILHQDLKPANILVEKLSATDDQRSEFDGLTFRVTDFGLARRLVEGGQVDSAVLGGTRRYMAPEQLQNDASLIGTHTDVFALGLILYELLTHPEASDESSRTNEGVVLTSEFSENARRWRRIPLNLQAIYRKCVEPDPAARYRDGVALHDDLRRFLNDQPVEARQAAPLEVAMGWLRRRPLAATLTAALFVSLLAGGVGMGVMYFRERTLRAVAEIRQEEARRIVHDTYTELGEKWMSEDGSLDEKQREFLLKALEYYERWAAEKPHDATRLHDASVAWHRVANMHSRLGNRKEGLAARRRCLEMIDRLLKNDPGNATYRYDRFYNLMTLQNESPTADEFVTCGLEAFREIKQLLAYDRENLTYRDAYVAAGQHAASALWTQGKHDEAYSTTLEALAEARKLAAGDPERVDFKKNVAAVLSDARYFAGVLGDVRKAIDYGQESIGLYKELVRGKGDRFHYELRLGEGLYQTALLQKQTRDVSSAKILLNEALQLQEQLCLKFPTRRYLQLQCIQTRFELGRLRYEHDEPEQGEAMMATAIIDAEALLKLYPDDRSYRAVLDQCLEGPVERLRDKKRAAELVK